MSRTYALPLPMNGTQHMVPIAVAYVLSETSKLERIRAASAQTASNRLAVTARAAVEAQ